MNGVQMVIQASCGFDALGKNLDALLSLNSGRKLESITVYVFFLGSNHVVMVVVLQR
jgi:hypothetical protein